MMQAREVEGKNKLNVGPYGTAGARRDSERAPSLCDSRVRHALRRAALRA